MCDDIPFLILHQRNLQSNTIFMNDILNNHPNNSSLEYGNAVSGFCRKRPSNYQNYVTSYSLCILIPRFKCIQETLARTKNITYMFVTLSACYINIHRTYLGLQTRKQVGYIHKYVDKKKWSFYSNTMVFQISNSLIDSKPALIYSRTSLAPSCY